MYYICRMKKHNGQLLELEVRVTGFSLVDLAKKLKVNRRTIYNWYAKTNLPLDVFVRVGDIIGVDFIKKYPEDVKGVTNTYQTPLGGLANSSDDVWKDKYIALLEETLKIKRENEPK